MLTDGLDSTSVACLAACELALSGQRLEAFSAVPMLGYRDRLPAFMLADETPFIEAVKENTKNIDVTYCCSEGKHSLNDTDQLLAMLEQPYKIIENFFWLDGIMAAAQKRKIGVILNGSAGNATISWGGFPTHLLTLLRSGQWFRLFYESWIYARRYHIPLKTLFKLYRKILFNNVHKKLLRIKYRDMCYKLQESSVINPEFARRISVRERFRRFGYDPLSIYRCDSYDMRQKHLSPVFFSHMGVITTKHALAYGMALRDPTMDKRVIEFCLSVPEHQFVRDGKDRFLLRRAMAGILPDKVRLNETTRGKQSADWIQRLQPSWLELAAEIRKIGEQDAERAYLDIAKIQRELKRYDRLNDDAADDSSLRMLIRSLIFSRFLKQEESLFYDRS